MFVYMTRQERSDFWGAPRHPPGSGATLLALLEEVSHSLWLATNQLTPCDKQDDCSACIAWAEAADLSDAVDNLLASWDERRYRIRSACRRLSLRQL